VAVDDASRLSYAAVKPNERQESAEEFFWEALTYFRRQGIRNVSRVLTDNGVCFHSRRFRRASKKRNIKHKFTKPYSPQTNGKAERFIQTMLNEWAYAMEYSNSQQRRR
jgi:transposase InsO family protein